MLAAAASLAACHNRSEDEVGAAPERGDTTAVTTADTTQALPADTTMGQTPAPTDTSFVQHDTTGMNPDTTATPSPSGNAPSDTVSQQKADTSAGAGAYDSTAVTPSDTTKQQ
jgi:hypothetical protein